MKAFIVSLLFAVTVFGAVAQDIELPRPAVKSGVDLLQAIKDRKVSKTFVKRDVPAVELSTILWSGIGTRAVDAVTSATKAGRNVSFSGDNAYINVYVLTDKGTWKYTPANNMLDLVTKGDSRAAVSKASAPDASILFLFTVDNALTPSFLKANPALFQQMANATAGFAAQNMALVASTYKLAAVVQYTLTPAGAATAAGLGKDEAPLFIMQIGYAE
ncbi:MAG: nitroreductase family protein [Rectinemataceae bacterium]